MFLDVLINHNPDLIRHVIALHQEDAIPANSYVIDLDAVTHNARTFVTAATNMGLTVFGMTKQFGRNPPAMDALADAGLDTFVAVDIACAQAIHTAGRALGNVGHLVQVPKAAVSRVSRMRPQYWTVFGQPQAHRVADENERYGRRQSLLLRVHRQGDVFLPGHEGGIAVDDLGAVLDDLQRRPGIRVAGLTSFPTATFDTSTGSVVATPNLHTLTAAAERLRTMGLHDIAINAPGTTSTAVLRMLADAGATQVEPGHALTGTTPLHAVRHLDEVPALLYVSEISHLHGGRAYFFGGGLYIDPVFPPYRPTALVGSDVAQSLGQRLPAWFPDASSIDFYGHLELDATSQVAVGDTVVFGFRPQAFVTRAHVVPLTGISTGRVRGLGAWTVDGRPSTVERAVPA